MSDEHKPIEWGTTAQAAKNAALFVSALALFLITLVVVNAAFRTPHRPLVEHSKTIKAVIVQPPKDSPPPNVPLDSRTPSDAQQSFTGTIRVETQVPNEPSTLFGLNGTDITFIFTLVGTLIGALVTYIGHEFAREHNKASLAQTKLESRRNATAKEREQRNQQIDTLVKWVGLLSTSDGKPVPSEQRGAALLVLAKFGHVDVALTYLASMWKANSIDSGTAVSIINEGLLSPDPKIQDMAATTLVSNAEKLKSVTDGKPDGKYEWPACVEWAWIPTLSWYSCEALLQSLLTVIAETPRAEWHAGNLRGTFVTLHAAMTYDTNADIKEEAARAALLMLKAFRLANEKELVVSEEPAKYRRRPIDDVQREVHSVLKQFSGLSQVCSTTRILLDKLEKWAQA